MTGFVSCGAPLATVMIAKGLLTFGIAALFEDFWVIVVIIFLGAFAGGVLFTLPALVRLAAYAFLSRQ